MIQRKSLPGKAIGVLAVALALLVQAACGLPPSSGNSLSTATPAIGAPRAVASATPRPAATQAQTAMPTLPPPPEHRLGVRTVSGVGEFSGHTADDEVLEYKPDVPVENFQFVRVVTVKSPSWVAWKEIEIFAP